MKRTDTEKIRQFWISKELDKQFADKCKDKAINASEWLRQQVEKFVKGE
jgi:hypothetical protein